MKRLRLLSPLSITLILSFLLIVFNVAIAQSTPALITYTDSENGFTIKHPANWKIDKSDINYKVTFGDPTESAFLGVAMHKVGADVKAKDFHLKFEEAVNKSMPLQNELPEKDRVLGAKELNASGASEGYLGHYTVNAEGQRLDMGVITLKKGEYIYVLVGIYAIDVFKTPDIVTQMEDSFKITK